ncbi:helix-turn-helix domain-containing protein [Aeromonas sp. QDB20]|uniref:helix-turn-helix domain-containing protein n=1 Tax=Aeromonas sp. QDB20 TaxID=2989835 RepID=UPI0022E65DFC|nr:helix-turn-helix domain-containing protein [Aeromonas sp. QDB20]
MKTLGQRIQERLDELGIKQAGLCRLSGVSKAAMSEIINNSERDLRAVSLFAIASALQVDPVWLYTGQTGDEWQAKHGVSEAKASQLKQKQRKTLPRLNRSKFYPRTFFN